MFVGDRFRYAPHDSIRSVCRVVIGPMPKVTHKFRRRPNKIGKPYRITYEPWAELQIPQGNRGMGGVGKMAFAYPRKNHHFRFTGANHVAKRLRFAPMFCDGKTGANPSSGFMSQNF